MLPRRRPSLPLKVGLNKIICRSFRPPSRKNAYLQRLPQPKPLEKIRLEMGRVVHPTGPVNSYTKGKEHVSPLDLDYKVVTPEDERVGLVLTGLHPSTHIKVVVDYLRKRAALRHCWVYSEGVCCVRFQDEDAKEQAKARLQGLETYPFRIYDVKNRHWFGPRPIDHPLPQVIPLTPIYSPEEVKESTVLVTRAILGLDGTTIAPFRRYGEKGNPVRYVYNKFYAHDRWIWEFFIKFPSAEAANLALENHQGQKITIPYGRLSTMDKLQYPYGKTQHLQLHRTGLDKLPPMDIQNTQLYDMIYKARGTGQYQRKGRKGDTEKVDE